MEAFALFAFLGVMALALLVPKKRRRRRTTKPKSTPQVKSSEQKPRTMRDPRNQLQAVGEVGFETVPLLNKAEYRVFAEVETLLEGSAFRVMAQVSMGEVLKPVAPKDAWKARKDAYASINSKRLDIAVIDRVGRLALAIEYQGKGHHQTGAYIRDAVKREALRRAGVQMLEVEHGTLPSELRQRVMNALGLERQTAAE